MGFVLRRSIPSSSGLVGLVLAVGFLFVVFAGASRCGSPRSSPSG